MVDPRRDLLRRHHERRKDDPGIMKNWLATATYVIPLDDLREHRGDDEECWCEPWYDGDILVHNAADKRELSEKRPV